MFRKSRQFKAFLQDKWQELYKVAYAWTSDYALASDLVQETITRSLRNKGDFNNSEEMKIWLFKVLRNCWLDHLRRQKPRVDITEIELADKTDLEEEFHYRQLLSQVEAAFQRMSIEHREILSLVVLEGMSYEATAEVLDIPTGTVMSRVSRARIALKQQIKLIESTNKLNPVLWRVK